MWAGEVPLSGNMIKDRQCNTTQLFNNGFSVPWLFEIQLLSLSAHPTKKKISSLFLGLTSFIRRVWDRYGEKTPTEQAGFAAKSRVLGKAPERISPFKHTHRCMCAHIFQQLG